MKYRIEIRYQEYLEYTEFEDFINAIKVLMQGGKKQMEISQVEEEA